MIDLDKNVVYTTQNVSEERVKKVFQWLLSNDEGWSNYNVNDIINVKLMYDTLVESWYFSKASDESISIDILFEEPFTNTVLVSNDLAEWSVEEVVLEHKGLYYCDRDGVLEPYNYIMKLTEEQKEYLNK